MFDNLKRVAIHELNTLDSMYANKEEFATEDAKKYDCLMHGLKCHLTSEAMIEAEEYSQDGMSGRRGRDPMTGRYVSRETRPDMEFAEGYNRGYSEAMNQSGHHWNMPPYPMDRYR